MTTMDRLTKKDILQRVKVGKAFEYQPCCDEEELNTKMSREIIKSLISNYGDLAIAQFVDIVENINPKKLEELKQSLLELDVVLEININPNIHDREIRFDNGWVIKFAEGWIFIKNLEVCLR